MWTKRRIEFLVPAFLVCVLALPFVVVWLAQPDAAGEIHEAPVLSSALPPARGGIKGGGSGEVAVSHVPLPDEVRGLYWTTSTATSARADELLAYMLETGLNTAVIDVKMDNGELAMDVGAASWEPLLERLREAGVYRIARVAVMRDGAFASARPELALRTTTGEFWYDSIGSVWVDPAAPEVADYAIDLGRALYHAGFDEIQYDYVRFASDGALSSIVYPVYDASDSKVEVMQRFFERVGGAMRAEGIPVSFDLFGMTFWSLNDYHIGQRLIDALPYADWVSPMVYPSHYPDGFEGYANPAEHPYEIVRRSLDEGLRLTHGVYAGGDEELAARFRPWLQDFDIGAVYTSTYIEAQIRATRDAGAGGWMLWNARNVYEPAQYLP